VGPSFPSDDSADMGFADSVHPPEFALSRASGVESPHPADIAGCELGFSMPFAPQVAVSSLRCPVGAVVGGRSWEEVAWIDATWVVACVQDAEVAGNWSVGDCPGDLWAWSLLSPIRNRP